jgi:hypothetical protein
MIKDESSIYLHQSLTNQYSYSAFNVNLRLSTSHSRVFLNGQSPRCYRQKKNIGSSEGLEV